MCDERERLLDYLYDACDAEERRRVDDHLETCEACRDEISGMREVRLNLLAWDVPEHGSVWTPFAPARQRPWYREVPAWAMAAAASVMFLVGLGGGLVAQKIAPVPAPAQLTAAQLQPQPGVQIVPVVSDKDLAAIEKRVLTVMQTQLDQRFQPIAAHVQTVSNGVSRDGIMEDVQHVVTASELRQRLALRQILMQDSEVMYLSKSAFNNFIKNDLPQRVQWAVTQAMAQQQQGGQR